MLKTCASCVVSQQNGKSKRRPFSPQRSNLLTNNARRLRRPFNTHALVEDENSDNDNRSAENILEKMPKKLEPPQRDTGIPSELDINIDIDEGTIFRVFRVFGFCALSLVLSERGTTTCDSLFLSLNSFKLFLCFCEEQHSIYILRLTILHLKRRDINNRTHEKDERYRSGNRELVVPGKRRRSRRRRVSVSMDGERRGGAG